MLLGEALLYSVSFFSLFSAIFFFITFFEQRHTFKPKTTSRFPKITIAVPAFNEEKTLAKTVRSLLNLDYPRNKLEIFIIDDGSTDKTYAIAKKFMKDGIQVITKPNTGKADSLNLVLSKATGEFFCALDADSFVTPDALKKMIGIFENPKVMAVTPSLKIWNPQGLLQRIQAMEYLVGLYLRKMFACVGSIHVTPGPFSIYRKSFFNTYGGYDKNNITEDIEVALRIQSNHYVIENVMDAVVYTVGPNTFKSLLIQRRRWFLGFLNNVINYKHLFHPSYGNLGLFILPASFISVALVILVCVNAIYRLAINLHGTFEKFSAIKFDLLSLLNFKIDTFFINITPLLVFSLVLISAGIYILYLAKKYSNEKGTIKFSYILYLLTYWFFFAFWWIVAIIYKVSNKNVQWGKKIS